ncbi:chemotaxis protein CheB [Chitinophagaceae bacterium MMS25-I14]
MKTKLVIAGGSAGSLQVLPQMLPGLHTDIPLIIILHRSQPQDTGLASLLASKTGIPVTEIEEKEPVQDHHIYIVPADYHVLIERDHTFSLDYSEKINYSRPSIDVLLESAAPVYGASLVCILLSGGNADGVSGFKAVKEAGGMLVVQDTETADVSYMPQQAIIAGLADYVLKPEEMAGFINRL